MSNRPVRGSPRYRVKPHDGVSMRFFSAKKKRVMPSQVVDISETGVAFTCSKKLMPQIGEVIKIEFNPPGGVQMACLGRVIRMEEPRESSTWAKFPDTIKVGVMFHGMPHAYKRVLSESLRGVLGLELTEHGKWIRPRSIRNLWVVRNGPSILITFCLVGLASLALYYLVQTADETRVPANEQTPWAKNFFEKHLTPSQDSEEK